MATKTTSPRTTRHRSPALKNETAHPAVKALAPRKVRPAAVPRKAAAAKEPVRPLALPVEVREAPLAPQGKSSKKAAKPRPVLVRDSFTMPEVDFALLAKLKTTALGASRAAKKSEILRAGLQQLARLDAEALVAALDRLETVKTGRPKKGHSSAKA